MNAHVMGVALAVLLIGCDGEVGSDGGATDRDAGARLDAGPRADGGDRADGGAGDDAGGVPPSAACDRLPPASGATITVTPAQADDLPSIVAGAASGTTILLEDGTYRSGRSGEGERRINFRTPGVTLRSASGDAEAVILDAEYMTNELIFIQANDTTIAELTLMRAVDHLVHATGDGATTVTGTRLYGVRFIDSGEQFVKVNGSGSGGFQDDGRLECSYFELTDVGRPNIERNPGGCYTGGIDTHSGRGWVVRGNTFVGIYCAGEGLAEHAVHFWSQSRDTLVENNTIINCARGVGFGLSQTEERRTYPDDPYSGIRPISHFDGVIRNNVIFADIAFYDTGIELQYARGAEVHHNTVVSTADATGFFSSIDYRFDTTDVSIRNNLTRRITVRGGASATLEANLEGVEMSLFEDAPSYDFHLAAGAASAIDQGVVVPNAGVDIDGDPHDNGRPDIGADER